MRRALYPLMAALLLPALRPAGADGWTQPKARVSLHVQPHVGKAIRVCLPPASGGNAPVDVPCSVHESHGALKVAYDAYLVVSGARPEAGIAGVQCGVLYDGAWGEGIDVFSWNLCADVQFPGQGTGDRWPAAGSGNIIVWAYDRNCQRRTISGHENEGVHAIAGAFYLTAYGEDRLRIVGDGTAGGVPRFAVADCAALVTELQEESMPSAFFGDVEGEKGCNPCLEPCAEAPRCVVEPGRLDFGEVAPGEDRFLKVVVANHGEGNLRGIAQIGFNLEFATAEGRGVFELAPGEEREVVVRFRPVATGLRRGTLRLANVCLDVPLRGFGLPVPVAAPAPGPVDGASVGGGRLRFTLADPAEVTVEIFDVSGRRVRRQHAGFLGAGEHRLDLDAESLPGGVYFARLRAGMTERVAKFVSLP